LEAWLLAAVDGAFRNSTRLAAVIALRETWLDPNLLLQGRAFMYQGTAFRNWVSEHHWHVGLQVLDPIEQSHGGPGPWTTLVDVAADG
jgi:hypothetical protein